MNAVLGGSTLSTDASTALVISSSSPDVAIRVSALRDVLKNAEGIKANGNESFVRETLLARLGEPDAEVASVVLAEENRSIVEQTLEAQEILGAVAPPIKSGDVAYLSVVLPYLTGSFVSSHSQLADQVVKTIFWPRLLSTKANSKENAATFSALKGSTLEKTHDWLKNISSASSSTGAEANSKVVDTIARNLAALPSEQLDEAIAFLLLQLAQPEPSHLSLLVALRFAGKVEKSRRVEFALSVLAALQVEEQGLESVAGSQAEQLFDAAGSLDASILQNLFVHPTVVKTSRQLRAATIIGVLQAVTPVQQASWQWLSTAISEDQAVVDNRNLCTLVYRISHTSSSTAGSAALAASLLSTLFTSLVADDVLAFLASVFSSHDVATELRLSALKECVVFIDVLSTANDKKVIDWQVVVPSVIAALGDAEKRVRVEGIKVLEKIRDVAVAKEGSKIGSVYGRDKFYGSTSCEFASFSANHCADKLTTSHLLRSFAQIPRDSRPPRLPHEDPRLSQRDHPLPGSSLDPPLLDARLFRQPFEEEEEFAFVQGFDLPPRSHRSLEVTLGSRQATQRARRRQRERKGQRRCAACRRSDFDGRSRPTRFRRYCNG